MFLTSQRMPSRYNAYRCIYNCIDSHTPTVTATGFFAGEMEIYDFVTECARRCIAAKLENELKFF